VTYTPKMYKSIRAGAYNLNFHNSNSHFVESNALQEMTNPSVDISERMERLPDASLEEVHIPHLLHVRALEWMYNLLIGTSRPDASVLKEHTSRFKETSL
jgi:hypothetical protein